MKIPLGYSLLFGLAVSLCLWAAVIGAPLHLISLFRSVQALTGVLLTAGFFLRMVRARRRRIIHG